MRCGRDKRVKEVWGHPKFLIYLHPVKNCEFERVKARDSRSKRVLYFLTNRLAIALLMIDLTEKNSSSQKNNGKRNSLPNNLRF